MSNSVRSILEELAQVCHNAQYCHEGDNAVEQAQSQIISLLEGMKKEKDTINIIPIFDTENHKVGDIKSPAKKMGAIYYNQAIDAVIQKVGE